MQRLFDFRGDCVNLRVCRLSQGDRMQLPLPNVF
jgi:hypothetical protein